MIQPVDYEGLYFNGKHDELTEKVDLSNLETSINLKSDNLLPFYFLSKSYERNGFLNEAWEIISLIERKLSKFTNSNENLAMLIYINLKIELMSKKGLNKEALLYLPIFGEHIEDNQLLPNLTTNEKFISLYYFNFGVIYQNIGEFGEAFKFYQKALAIISNNERFFPFCSEIFNKIGEIFMEKGEYLYANHNLEMALELSEKYNHTHAKIAILLSITNLNMCLENYCESKNILETLFAIISRNDLLKDVNMLAKIFFTNFMFQIRLNEQKDILESSYKSFIKNISSLKNQHTPLINFIVLLVKGIYFHRKNNLDSIEQAKNILESCSLFDGIDITLSIIARKELCEIYLKEMKYLKKSEIIPRLQSLIKELLNQAKKNHFYPLLIEVYLLQSNMELYLNSKYNISNSEKYLLLADIISQEKNIRQLTSKIVSSEIKFKDQIERWQHFVQSKPLQKVSSLQNNPYYKDLKDLLLTHRPG